MYIFNININDIIISICKLVCQLLYQFQVTFLFTWNIILCCFFYSYNYFNIHTHVKIISNFYIIVTFIFLEIVLFIFIYMKFNFMYFLYFYYNFSINIWCMWLLVYFILSRFYYHVNDFSCLVVKDSLINIITNNTF